jgi:hypothetical protein
MPFGQKVAVDLGSEGGGDDMCDETSRCKLTIPPVHLGKHWW